MTDRSISDDYDFREQIYDATMEAHRNGGISLVVANWHKRTIVTEREFASLTEVSEFVRMYLTIDDFETYIIGADIEEVA